MTELATPEEIADILVAMQAEAQADERLGLQLRIINEMLDGLFYALDQDGWEALELASKALTFDGMGIAPDKVPVIRIDPVTWNKRVLLNDVHVCDVLIQDGIVIVPIGEDEEDPARVAAAMLGVLWPRTLEDWRKRQEDGT